MSYSLNSFSLNKPYSSPLHNPLYASPLRSLDYIAHMGINRLRAKQNSTTCEMGAQGVLIATLLLRIQETTGRIPAHNFTKNHDD